MNNELLFDKILCHKRSNQNIVANSYLHILNAHPEFLKKYELTKKEKVWLPIRYMLIMLFRLIQSSFYDSKFSCNKHTIKSEVLFVSHLTNSLQLSQDKDAYFGNLPEYLLEYDIRSSIALINYTKLSRLRLLDGWRDSDTTRFVLNKSLSLLSELKLCISQMKSLKCLRKTLKEIATDDTLEKDILRQHLSSDTFNALRIAEQVANIVEKVGAKYVITTYEGYPWERLVYYYVRKINPYIKCLGYQHAAVFKNQYSIKRSLRDEYNPDVILTSGIISQNIFIKSGFDESKVCCLGSFKNSIFNLSNRENKCCLVVPEGLIDESLILFKFSLAYALQYKKQMFIWRLHPLLDFERIKKQSSILDSLPENIHLSDSILQDDIDKCDSVLYRGSTVVVNAINSGLKPIYYQQSTNEPSIDPVYQLKHCKKIVLNHDQLKKALETTIDQESRQKLHKFAQEFYTPIDLGCLLKLLQS